MEEINYQEMLLEAGISSGMTVDIVSDLFNITKAVWCNDKTFNAENFIKSLCTQVGENGNVLIRAFNWDFCSGKEFNRTSTPSQTGALGNIAMKVKNFSRTKHPLYSFFVWGRNREALCEKDYKDAFGSESIFAWEHRNEAAYQLVLGSPQTNGLTLFHYMEQYVGVFYRYKKDFCGVYRDIDGSVNEKKYSMYVRDLNYENYTDDGVYMAELLEKGIRVDSDYEGIKMQRYHIPSLCDVYEKDFRKNKIPTGVTLKRINK